MTWKLFNKIIQQLPDETVIVPFFRGESILYSHLTETMCKLRRFKEVQLATNGDMLTNEKLNFIAKTVTFLSLSLHSFILPLTHTRFVRLLKRARKRGVTTQISIVETLIPEGQKDNFVKSWLEHVDKVRVYVEHTHRGYGDTLLKIDETGLPCTKPFHEMVVYWDGKVALCCHDWNNRLNLGNLNTQSVEEVWNGQPYKSLRSRHLHRKRHTVESCRNCDQWIASYMPNKILGELYTNES